MADDPPDETPRLPDEAVMDNLDRLVELVTAAVARFIAEGFTDDDARHMAAQWLVWSLTP